MFCFKCGDLLSAGDNCQNCQKQKNTNFSCSDLSPICLGYLPSEEERGPIIMTMGQVFDDERRRWNGYFIYFYPHEFAPPQNKSLNLLHIHLRGSNSEIRVYLSNLEIEIKWGNIPFYEKNKKRFVERNYQDIINKVESELRKIGLK